VLGFFTAIQAVFILFFRDQLSLADRLHQLGLNTYGISVWTQTVGLYMLGLDFMRPWAHDLFVLAVQHPNTFQLEGRLLTAGMAFLFVILLVNLPKRQRILFGGSYLILTVLTMMFSVISDKYGLFLTGLHQRLFMAPNVIFAWMLFFGMSFARLKGWRGVSRNLVPGLSLALLCVGLWWGVIQFGQDWTTSEPWHDWKQEVQVWRQNPDYALKIQPEGFTVSLKK
jgi:hypothetical protein